MSPHFYSDLPDTRNQWIRYSFHSKHNSELLPSPYIVLFHEKYKYMLILKSFLKDFLTHSSLSDQCVGSSSTYIGCRMEKQRQLLSESVYIHFCAAKELSCCQRLEVDAEIVVIDITCCSYSSGLQKLDSCWHEGITLLLLTAVMGRSLSPFWASWVSQLMV